MKKLDDIPKRRPFNVPEGYFESLPGRIQARIEEQSPRRVPVLGQAMKYAMAVLLVLALAFAWLLFRPGASPAPLPETILASVETRELVAYLKEADITTDELLDDALLDNEDANEIQGVVFTLDLDVATLDAVVSEID